MTLGSVSRVVVTGGMVDVAETSLGAELVKGGAVCALSALMIDVPEGDSTVSGPDLEVAFTGGSGAGPAALSSMPDDSVMVAGLGGLGVLGSDLVAFCSEVDE